MWVWWWLLLLEVFVSRRVAMAERVVSSEFSWKSFVAVLVVVETSRKNEAQVYEVIACCKRTSIKSIRECAEISNLSDAFL